MIHAYAPVARAQPHRPPAVPRVPPKAPPPRKTAADFERDLTAVAERGSGVALAALSYMDIALALEARGLVAAPSLWQRARRRLQTMPSPSGFTPKRFQRCFAEGLRCSTEAALRYYGIDPGSVGLPTAQDALSEAPARICEQVVRARERARATMARREFPGEDGQADKPVHGCTCRAAFDSANAQLTVYIDWFNGRDESTGVHHCVPLLVATRHRRRHFTFPRAGVNALPKTSRERGYAPFRYTADRILERLSPA